ncbi:MAG: PriCT-2 domain-containing protein [Alphaproteobacteria bacterium]|nr:PriCT-2 domain-containing protein [Alphaproteobacteria bacterium]
MTNFMAQHSARLVDNGFPVIPIWPGTKKPGRFHRGEWCDYPEWTRHCDRATTEHEIDIWSAWPEAAIGFACGTIVGIDIDILDPEAAHAAEQLARQMLGDTPLLRIGKAPKRMLVYRTETPFAAFRRAPLEVLGHGRQFVAFAVHPDTGQPYVWPEESPLSVDAATLPIITEEQARAWLDAALALLPQDTLPAVLPTGSGGQRQTSHSLAGTREAVWSALAFIPNADLDYDSWVRIGMALKGALGEAGFDLFSSWSNQAGKNVPETTDKAWASFKPTAIGAGTIYHLAMERGWKPDPTLVLDGAQPRDDVHPAAGLLASLTAQAVEQQSDEPEPVSISSPPTDFFTVDGALKLMVDYILSTAIRPQPVLAIGASLCALGVLMGHKYRTSSNLRSNLYVVGLAASGGGKDHARSAIKEAFLAAGLDAHIGGNKLASGAGLLAALYRQPASLFQIDEFGHFLNSVVNKRNTPKHLAEIWDLLTELATSAGSTFFGAEYADQKQRPRQDIIQPCCALHATTVPETFWAALGSGSLADGSLARFLIFQSDNDIPDRVKRPAVLDRVPPELISALQSVAAGAPNHAQGNLSAAAAPTIKPEPFTVPMTPEAEDLFDQLDEDVTRRQRQAAHTNHGAVLARVWENTAKVALIRAVSADPKRPVIALAHAQWARSVVEHCTSTMLAEAEQHIATNEIEANHKKVLRIIGAAGSAGLTRSELYHKTHFLGSRRDDLFADLAAAGEIEIDLIITKSRPKTVYRRKL